VPQEAPLSALDSAAFDRVVGVAVRVLRADPRGRIVIDGRSGAGKTTLARRVAELAGARLVSLAEFYEGWSGLAGATAVAARLVADHAAGSVGRYHRWDWERGEYSSRETTIDPSVALVVEGCGALSESAAAHASTSIWIDGDAAVRKRLALTRDGDSFAPYWEMWEAQEEEHIRANDPERLAQLSFSATWTNPSRR
jgi:uridine kinase